MEVPGQPTSPWPLQNVKHYLSDRVETGQSREGSTKDNITQENSKGGKSTLSEISQEGHSSPENRVFPARLSRKCSQSLNPRIIPGQHSPRGLTLKSYSSVSSCCGQSRTKTAKGKGALTLETIQWCFSAEGHTSCSTLSLTHKPFKSKLTVTRGNGGRDTWETGIDIYPLL